MRKDEKRYAYNKAIKNRLNTTVRKVKQAVEEKKLDSAQSLLQMLYKFVDKAVLKKVLKKNTGARKKSKWAKLLNAAAQGK